MKLTPVLILAFASSMLAQEPQLTARDAFWSASDLVQVSANPAQPQAAKAAPVPRPPKRPPPRPKAPSAMGAHLDPAVVTENGYGAQPHLQRIAASAPQPLGVRYTVLRESAGGYAELLPDSVFHSGDKIKLSVMANQPGYLYLIERGTSGAWQALFPEPAAAADSNRVQPGQVYMIPSAQGRAFQFNDLPGEERLFLLLSRSPVADLDTVIFDLQQRSPAPSGSAEPSGGAQQVAQARIDDELVQRLQSRDLTLVTESTAPAQGEADYGEKAVYVVNQGGPGADPARVFANFALRHE